MSRAITLAAVAVLAGLAIPMPAMAEDCPLLQDFNQALQRRDLEAVKGVEAKIRIDAACGPFTLDAQRRRVLLEVTMAEALIGRTGREAEREALLVDADRPEVFWGAAMALGELRLAQRQFVEAAQALERAIEIVKNTTKTPRPPANGIIQEMLDRSAQARLLAANEEQAPATATYVHAARDHRDGSIGGSLSEDVRGLKPKSVPIPVNFETGTATPTAIGRQALDELLAAIKEQRPAEMVIVGHTDERGSDAMNLRLSQQRARMVADFLARNGATAKMTVQAAGKREPLAIADRTGLTQEDVWALNRRVEWRRPAAGE
jgi:outer membrane protein OmpA-like peptidoglycan-associated protein